MKKYILHFLWMLSMIVYPVSIHAQELEDLLNEVMEEEIQYATAAFKATRIMNGHSIERMQEGVLDFRISHRFGTLNSGAYEFFGLDQSNIHLSFEYGIKDWLMIGVGRSSFQKTFNGFTKFSILRQSTGVRNIPVFVTYLAVIEVNSMKWDNPERQNYFTSRLSYVQQLMVARKFGKRLSLQLTPTMVHRNLVETELDQNDLWSFGAGGRLKLTNRISINAEYFYVIRSSDQLTPVIYNNPLAIGFDIETGGHVFQLIFTNSVAMIEGQLIGETTGRWIDGDIHFGFNLSRVFTLKRK